MNKQKVMFFFLRLLDAGGVSTHCADLAGGLRSNGYEVIFIYGGEESSFKGKEWFINQGFKIHHIGFSQKKNLKNYLKSIASYTRFVTLLYRYRPEIIHCHFRSTAIFAMIGKALTKSRSVLTVHLHNMPSSPVTRFFQSKFDKYIAISSEIEEDLLDMNIDQEKIDKIYNGVDDTRYTFPSPETKAALRLKYGYHPEKLIIVLVARLAKVKSIDTLIKAIAELSPDLKDRIECIIVGDGTYKESLTDLSKQYQLENIIHFPGYCDPVDYYALSDVFVLPSIKEGFSISVVEAMLSGLAIVRTPTSGCYDQVIENENGYIIPFYDHIALANKLEFLIENPDKLKSMQDASYNMAESRFTLKVMTENTMKIYDQVTKVDEPA